MKEQAEIFVLGTDEAGYGPNLGPLLLGCSCWQIALDLSTRAALDSFLTREGRTASAQNEPIKKSKKKKVASSGPTLFDLAGSSDLEGANEEASASAIPCDANELGDDWTRRAIERLNSGLASISDRKGLFPLVDSKKLYSGGSLATLERSFFLALATLDSATEPPKNFRDVLRRVAREDDASDVPPWEEKIDFPLPRDPKTGTVETLAERLCAIRALFDDARVRPIDLSARRVHPREFNALLDRLGLKSDLIAEATLSTVVETLERVLARSSDSREPRLCLALCDKLGGRDRYAPTLLKRFPGAELCVLLESRATSVYRLIAETGLARDGRVARFRTPIALEIRFTAKGESNAPTALASICAKYLRELSMDAFNDFWRKEFSETLRPTAGYPVDALRFRAEVEQKRDELGIEDAIFWRKK